MAMMVSVCLACPMPRSLVSAFPTPVSHQAHGHTSDAFGKTESVCAILDIVPNLFEVWAVGDVVAR